MQLITKFNRMIRNRFLWGAFAVIVSLSMVGFLSQGAKGCDSSTKPGVIGQLNGEDVTRQELAKARFFEMGMRPTPSLPPEADEALQQAAWRRLAVLQTARKWGLTTSDDELREVIGRDPSFAVDGQFNKEMYKARIQSFLRMADAEPLYEEYRREDITLRKAFDVLASAVWISPAEIMAKLKDLTDEFTIEYAVLNIRDFDVDVDITREDAETFFNENAEMFREPEKHRVRYVTLPISNYLAGVDIAYDRISEYYTNHLEEYSTLDTNDIAVPIPMADVTNEIRTLLERQSAMFMAKDAATEFVVALAPDRYGKATTMEKAAEAFQLTILTTRYFSASADLPELKIDDSFIRAASALEKDDPDSYFSDAIAGEDDVYVIAANDKLDTRIPVFEEVAERVMPFVTSNAVRTAFMKKAYDLRAGLDTAVAAGNTFLEVAPALGMNVVTTQPFTVYGGLPTNEMEYAAVLVPNLYSMNERDVSDPLETRNGALLVHVISRTPGEPGALGAVAPLIRNALERYHTRLAFQEWGTHLLANAAVNDLTVATMPDEADEPPDEPDEEGME